MTIGKKIAALVAMQCALLMVLGGVVLLSVGKVEEIVVDLSSDSLPGALSVGRVVAALKDVRGASRNYLTLEEAGAKAKAEKDGAAAQELAMGHWTEYEKTVTRAEEKQAVGAVKGQLETFLRLCGEARRTGDTSGNKEGMGRFRDEAIPAFGKLQEGLDGLLKMNADTAKAQAGDLTEKLHRGTVMVWVLLLVAVVGGGGLSYWVVRGMNERLLRIVTEVSQAMQEVTSASQSSASGSQTLAQGASRQAASIEETSAACHEISSITDRNAENAKRSAERMGEVDERVRDANRMLAEMEESMKSIVTSSDSIAKIIKVIDGIAFQTNILALNAAVEAARAGEAGQGFAVVADEVRSLAQRCAQAARDTNGQIEAAVRSSQEGGVKLERVAAAIGAITASTAEVRQMVDEVHRGSEEQTRGMAEISRGVSQMENVTQGFAASAEEGASVSEELTAQTAVVRDAVVELEEMVAGPRGGRPRS